MKHFLSVKQVELFDLEIKKWLSRLGLADWVVYRRPSKAKGARADISPNYEARQAGYRTGNFGSMAPTDHDIEVTAVHELMHVVLAELIHVVGTSDDPTLIASAEHRVINTITALLVPVR